MPTVDPRDLDLTLRQLLVSHAPGVVVGERPVPMVAIIEALIAAARKRKHAAG